MAAALAFAAAVLAALELAPVTPTYLVETALPEPVDADGNPPSSNLVVDFLAGGGTNLTYLMP